MSLEEILGKHISTDNDALLLLKEELEIDYNAAFQYDVLGNDYRGMHNYVELFRYKLIGAKGFESFLQELENSGIEKLKLLVSIGFSYDWAANAAGHLKFWNTCSKCDARAKHHYEQALNLAKSLSEKSYGSREISNYREIKELLNQAEKGLKWIEDRENNRLPKKLRENTRNPPSPKKLSRPFHLQGRRIIYPQLADNDLDSTINGNK